MRKFQYMIGGALGAMTVAERAKGRYMRAPDEHPVDDFAEFEKSGEVEGSFGDAGESDEQPKPKPKPRKAAVEETPANDGDEGNDASAGDEGDEGEDDEGGEGGEDDEQPKPKRKASDRIRELNRRLREEQRGRVALEARLEAIEKGGLQPPKSGGNSATEIGDAPDPNDQEKYPLGHLDERYVEDRIAYEVTKVASAQADAVLQRQQENEQAQSQRQQHEALLEKVEDLATRGSEQYEDFQEAVIEAGMKGEWQLGQTTFEAAHEAEHGAEILYDLSQDKKEAARVAKLSSYGQMKFVQKRDAEISAKSKPRHKPGAGAPPQTSTRGANSRTRISPSTDNLDDFEKAWQADAKGR